jgi:antitoxin MazE
MKVDMVTKVQKWGNSQGLRLAKRVLEGARLAVGDDVTVVVRREQIVIRKASKPKFVLAEMVSRMPAGYKAGEVSFGRPMGKEVW